MVGRLDSTAWRCSKVPRGTAAAPPPALATCPDWEPTRTAPKDISNCHLPHHVGRERAAPSARRLPRRRRAETPSATAGASLASASSKRAAPPPTYVPSRQTGGKERHSQLWPSSCTWSRSARGRKARTRISCVPIALVHTPPKAHLVVVVVVLDLRELAVRLAVLVLALALGPTALLRDRDPLSCGCRRRRRCRAREIGRAHV